jgi:regulator of sigma E protease
MLITILAMVIVLGVLIFVHELGHFMTAKAVDIEVPRFSIGFGPKVIGFTRGETEYVISLLPLGGYVKMAGTEDMEMIEGGPATVNDIGEEAESAPQAPRKPGPRDFDAKSLPARALVISAGVIMNLIFAFVVFSVLAGVWGVPADVGTGLSGVAEEVMPEESLGALSRIEPGSRVTAVNGREVDTRRAMDIALLSARAGDAQITLDNGQTLTFQLPAADTLRRDLVFALEPMVAGPPVISTVEKNGPADRAGIKPRDRVIEIAGRPVSDWSELVRGIENNAGSTIPVVVDRGGERVALTITPSVNERGGVRYGRVGIGRSATAGPVERPSVVGAIQHGATRTWETVALTVDFLAGMFTGRQSPRSMGGPIMIGQLSGEVARLGLDAFLGFMALLSVNLAVLNLLPIPVLDGGHLVFLGIEAVRGRPLSIQQRMRWTQVGFFIIVGIMVWAMGNDLLRVFGL